MSAVATVVGSGKHTYEVHEDWARLPDGWEIPAASVTVALRVSSLRTRLLRWAAA